MRAGLDQKNLSVLAAKGHFLKGTVFNPLSLACLCVSMLCLPPSSSEGVHLAPNSPGSEEGRRRFVVGVLFFSFFNAFRRIKSIHFAYQLFGWIHTQARQLRWDSSRFRADVRHCKTLAARSKQTAKARYWTSQRRSISVARRSPNSKRSLKRCARFTIRLQKLVRLSLPNRFLRFLHQAQSWLRAL
jgi:hypothetical protein